MQCLSRRCVVCVLVWVVVDVGGSWRTKKVRNSNDVIVCVLRIVFCVAHAPEDLHDKLDRVVLSCLWPTSFQRLVLVSSAASFGEPRNHPFRVACPLRRLLGRRPGAIRSGVS